MSETSRFTAHRIIKNTGFLYAKMGITMFISLYTTRLILNSLGISDFGIFNIVGGAIAMLGFINAGLASATQRFMSYSEGEGDKYKQTKIFNISFIMHFIIAMIMCISLIIFGWIFFNKIINIDIHRIAAAKVIYYSLIISTVFTVMTVPYDAVLNAHENMLYYSIVGIIESVFKLLIAIIVIHYKGDRLIIYGVLMSISPIISMIIMRIYCHKNYSECIISPKKYWDIYLLKEITNFAGWNFLSISVMMISSYGQGIVLNVFFGSILNTAQGIANQVSGQLQFLSSNLLKALNPVLDKSAGADDNARLITTTLLGAKYSTALFTMIALPIFFQTPLFLKYWLDNIPDWSITFVRLQIIKSFIEFQFITLPGAIYATGKIKKYTLTNIVFNGLQLPLIYIFFYLKFPPYFMYIISIIFGNIFVYISALYFTKIYCNIKTLDYLRQVSKPIYSVLLLSISFVYLFLSYVKTNSLMSFISNTLIIIFVFIILYYYIGCSKNERKAIKDISIYILKYK